MQIPENNMPTNALLAGLASAPQWLATFVEPTLPGFLASAALSLVLLFLGKLADLGIKVYLEKRGGIKTKDKSDSTD